MSLGIVNQSYVFLVKSFLSMKHLFCYLKYFLNFFPLYFWEAVLSKLMFIFVQRCAIFRFVPISFSTDVESLKPRR